MNIAVLGSGNGGSALACEWALKGHEVHIVDFERFPSMIRAIQKTGHISSQGQIEGNGRIKYAGFDFGKAIENAELIFAVGPAYSTEPFAEACRPHLRKGQIYVVCPTSCLGSLAFKRGLGLQLEDNSVIVAETSTLPYAVRILEPGRIHVYNRLKAGYFVATLPSNLNERVFDMLVKVHDGIQPAKNVWQTTFQNGNVVIHPAVSLLNTALIERTNGDFSFYEDGITPAVGRLMKALDEERIAIGKKLGVMIMPEPEIGVMQGYMTEANYDTGYSSAPGFAGIKAPSSLHYRYFDEDVGYSLVFMQDVGKRLKIDTPTMDAEIHLISVVMDRDYRSESNRTLETLGLKDIAPEALPGCL